MSTPLRLSPSGPVLGDISPGFLLRQIDVVDEIEADIVIPLSPAAVTIAEFPVGAGGQLAAPRPDRLYSAELWCDFQSTDQANAEPVNMSIEVDWGDGVWLPVASTRHLIAPAVAAGSAARHGRVNVQQVLGASAPWSMPVAAEDRPSMRIRGRASMVTGTGTAATVPELSSAYLRLSEYLP